MDNKLTPEQENEIIEDALKNHLLAPMPRSVTTHVMTRIQNSVRPSLLSWNDFALSLVIVLCMSALFFTVQSLPAVVLIKLRIQGILLYQDVLVNARWLVPAIFFGLAAVLSALTVPSLYQMTRDQRR